MFRLASAKIGGKKPHPLGVFTAFHYTIQFFVWRRQDFFVAKDMRPKKTYDIEGSLVKTPRGWGFFFDVLS